MGLGWAQRLLELLGARSATEFTSSTLHFGSDPFRTRMVKDTPSLQTLVLRLTCTRLLWRPVVSKVPVPSIRTIILCQESALPTSDVAGQIFSSLSTLLSRILLPSLERVCYVTHEEGGSVWNM